MWSFYFRLHLNDQTVVLSLLGASQRTNCGPFTFGCISTNKLWSFYFWLHLNEQTVVLSLLAASQRTNCCPFTFGSISNNNNQMLITLLIVNFHTNSCYCTRLEFWLQLPTWYQSVGQWQGHLLLVAAGLGSGARRRQCVTRDTALTSVIPVCGAVAAGLGSGPRRRQCVARGTLADPAKLMTAVLVVPVCLMVRVQGHTRLLVCERGNTTKQLGECF